MKELISWCDIFNNYKEKLELFYQHIKTYKNIIKEINYFIAEIKKVILIKIKKTQLNITDNDAFMRNLADVVFSYSGIIEFKEISILSLFSRDNLL